MNLLVFASLDVACREKKYLVRNFQMQICKIIKIYFEQISGPSTYILV